MDYHIKTEDFLTAYYKNLKQKYHYNDSFTEEQRYMYKKKVQKKVKQLMKLPKTYGTTSTLMWVKKREGYTIKKYVIYPEKYMAVSFLIMIPENIKKAPGVLCIAGSSGTKEMMSNEPELNNKPTTNKHPIHNAMAYHYVKAGYVSIAVESPGIGELKHESANIGGDRSEFSGRMIMMGRNYVGISVFQKLCILDWMKKQPYIDETKLVLSGHSLGVEPIPMITLLRNDIKAIIYNDFIGDRLVRKNVLKRGEIVGGLWHEIPDMFTYFTYIDLLCYLAPTPILLPEGGITSDIDRIRTAYITTKSSNQLSVYYYKKYQNIKDRLHEYEEIPENITLATYYDYANIDVSNHFFKEYHAIPWLNKILNYRYGPKV